MVGNKYRRWTQEDDLRLLELRAVGRSAISISAALKRSTGAVHGRLSILRALAKSPKLLPEKERPRPDARIDTDIVRLVDDWRRHEDDLPNRPETIRRLVELGLKAKGK